MEARGRLSSGQSDGPPRFPNRPLAVVRGFVLTLRQNRRQAVGLESETRSGFPYRLVRFHAHFGAEPVALRTVVPTGGTVTPAARRVVPIRSPRRCESRVGRPSGGLLG